MSLWRMLDFLGSGLFGLMFKIMFMLLLFTFVLGIVFVLVLYWPFTVCMVVGLVLSEQMYKRLSKRLNIRLPAYFKITLLDFVHAFSEGDDELDAARSELKFKREKASAQLSSMRSALVSIDEQLDQVRTRRSLKTLFKRNPVDVSSRAVAALEAELSKPYWTSWVETASSSANGDWDKYMA